MKTWRWIGRVLVVLMCVAWLVPPPVVTAQEAKPAEGDTQPVDKPLQRELTAEQLQEVVKLMQAGYFERSKANHEGAAEKFEEALKIWPERGRIKREIVLSLMETEKLEHCPRIVTLVGEIQDEFAADIGLQQGLAKALVRLGKYEPARAVIDKLMKVNEEDVVTWTVLGLYYFEQEQYKEALATYQKASDIYTKNKTIARPELVYAVALCHQRLKDVDSAIKVLEELKVLVSFDPQVHYRLGRLYQEKQEAAKARICFENFIKVADFTDAHWEEVCRELGLDPALPVIEEKKGGDKDGGEKK